MSVFSKEYELSMLERWDGYIDQRLELERQYADEWDLVPRSVVMQRMQVSDTTLLRWEELGLKTYQPPVEKAKKVYYRKSDILRFLSTE